MGMYTAEAWHVIQQRCSFNKAVLWVCTTPYSWNFLKKDLYDPWLASGKDHPEINVFQVPSISNPFFPLDEYEKAKRNFPRWKFDMFYRGMFTRPAGLVYSDYTTTTIPLANPVRTFAGFDYGYNNPASIVWIIEDGRGNYQIQRVWKKSQADHDVLASAMKSTRCEYYGDPSAAGVINEMKKRGISIEPGKNDVMAGIGVVDSMFRTGRLTILEGETSDLIEELGLYSWQTDGSGEPVEKIEKSNDHTCDALRYAIFTGMGENRAHTAVHSGGVLQTIRETARF